MKYIAAAAVMVMVLSLTACPPDKSPTEAQAQAASPAPPAPVRDPGPKLSSDHRMLLLHAYADAFAYSNDQQRRMNKLCEDDLECKLARENTTKAINVWNATVPKVIQEEKLPAGTGFNVDIASGQVFVVLPPTIGAEKK